MKLRNKKTGGLASVEIIVMDDEKDDYFRVYTDAGYVEYNTLAELCGEWEDYEPKEPLIKGEKIERKEETASV